MLKLFGRYCLIVARCRIQFLNSWGVSVEPQSFKWETSVNTSHYFKTNVKCGPIRSQHTFLDLLDLSVLLCCDMLL